MISKDIIVVIDSNVLFSALIRDSITRKIILEYDGKFIFPSFVIQEMEKHKKMLLSKSGMQAVELESLLSVIFSKVQIINDSDLKPYKEKALELGTQTDPDDAIFFACALAHHKSIIWSNEIVLKEQSRVRVLNTKEIIKLFYG
jgi:predicted nucleic acid-binding protein